MRRVLVGFLGMVAACAVASEPARAASCPDADAPYAPGVNDEQVRSGLLCLVNNERLARGLGAVVEHPALDRAGQRHLEDMAAREYVDHVAPAPAPFGATPHERAEAAGYPGTLEIPSWKVGETLHTASQTLPVINPGMTTGRAAVAGWMASASHCTVILTRELEHLGAGVLRTPGADGWVTDSFALVLAAIGEKMTPSGSCPATTGLVPADAVPAAPEPGPAWSRATSVPVAGAPSDTAPAGLALGRTGVYLTSGAAIKLSRGAAAALMTLRCERPAGRCRGTVALRAKGRSVGRARFDLAEGVATRLTVPIASRQRKLLKGSGTRASVTLTAAGATGTRVVTLRR